jgi:sec-independent protein translocase protein TatA
MNIVLQPLAFMEGLGGPEVLLIMVIILVLFGGEKLPEFARGAGKLIKEFKKASSGVEEEFKRALEEDELKKTIAPPAAALPPAPSPAMPDSAESDAPTASSSSPSPSPSPPKMLPTENSSGDT